MKPNKPSAFTEDEIVFRNSRGQSPQGQAVREYLEQFTKDKTMKPNRKMKMILHPTDPENNVLFTQFLFPDGAKKLQWIKRSPDVFDKAKRLYELGFSLEIENDNGRIWMSCVNHATEQAKDAWCENGPIVPTKVDELIISSYELFIGET